jgi:hypothetical protein
MREFTVTETGVGYTGKREEERTIRLLSGLKLTQKT